jgi:hypothetical protein
MARQFYASSGELPIRITPFHSIITAKIRAAGMIDMPHRFRRRCPLIRRQYQMVLI